MRTAERRARQLSLLEADEEGTGLPAAASPAAKQGRCQVAGFSISRGRVGALVVTPEEEGAFRASLTAEPFSDRLSYLACSALLGNVGWWKSLADGREIDLDRLAWALYHEVPRECRDVNGMAAECACGAAGGGCEHVDAARSRAATELAVSHRKGLLLHGFDLGEWAESPEVLEAGLAIRDLRRPWGERQPYWEPAPMPEPPDLSAIPFLRDGILEQMARVPHGKEFAGRMREWMGVIAGMAASLEGRHGEGRGCALESGRLMVTVGADGKMASLFLTPPGGHGPGAPPPPEPSARNLVSLLADADPGSVPQLDEINGYWVLLFRYVARLARQGALVPEIVQDFGEGAYRALWRPATGLDGKLHDIHAKFLGACPFALLRVRGGHALSGKLLLGNPEVQLRQAVDLLHRGIAELAWEKREKDGRGTAATEDGTDAGFGWDFVAGFPPGMAGSWVRRWFRQMGMPRKRPRMGLAVMPEERKPQKIRLEFSLHDEDGKRETLDRILGRRPSPSFLENVQEVLVAFGLDPSEFLKTPSVALSMDLADYPGLESDLLDIAPVADILLDLSDRLRVPDEPRVACRMAPTGRPVSGLFDMRSLVSFDWKVAMGDRDIGVGELRELVRHARKQVDKRMRRGGGAPRVVIVHGGGRYVRMDRDFLERIGAEVEKPGLSHFELLRAALTGEHAGVPVDLDREARRLLEETLSPRDPPSPPDGLGEVLRPYQRTGFEWLAQNADIGFGSILADDMGLGKTLQAIALLAHRTARDPSHKTLVVAPTALLTNWLREIRRFAPRLRARIYHGTARRLDIGACDVVLTSYGIAMRDAERLGAAGWGLMVADEAQNIKNPATKQSRAIKGYRAAALVAMTGTPVENHLGDYWSIFDFTNRGYLGAARRFREEIAVPIERDRDEGTLRRFRKMTGPFILRRLKTDKSVIRDLPEKIEGRQFCALAPAQAALYKATVERLMGDVAGSGSADDGRNMRRRGLILKMLTALKQVCDSPALYLRKGKALPSESGKLALCLEILRELADTGEKALVFTQYVEMGKLLVDAVQADLGSQPLFLHGGLGRKARDRVVDRFQQDPEARNMVLSLKAGGTGLNLTAATQVIHFDRWWNPAVEAQATDRAFRIGQTRRVQVHVLVTENTLEERIDEMLAAKRELSELTVRSGEKWLTEMDDRQLRELVELTRPLG